METKRSKEQEKLLRELARQEKEINDRREGIKRERQLLQMELDELHREKDAVSRIKGEKELRDKLVDELVATIHEFHYIDVETAARLFPKATTRVLMNRQVLNDERVLEALEYERKLTANKIKNKWMESDDFRAQMAVFRLTATNEELVRLNAVQKRQLGKGDKGTQFDVQVLSSRAEAAEYVEILDNNEGDEDEIDQ